MATCPDWWAEHFNPIHLSPSPSGNPQSELITTAAHLRENQRESDVRKPAEKQQRCKQRKEASTIALPIRRGTNSWSAGRLVFAIVPLVLSISSNRTIYVSSAPWLTSSHIGHRTLRRPKVGRSKHDTIDIPQGQFHLKVLSQIPK